MARRRNRFSRLDALYRAVKGNIPADNTELTNYIEWRKGNRKIKVTKTLDAQQRKRFGFGILPFNREVAATPAPFERVAAPITGYSNEGRKSLALSNADCGYVDIDGNTQQVDNFFPAVLRVFVKTNANDPSVDKTSDITGNSYKRHNGSTYSIPFGRSLEGDDDGSINSSGEDDVKNALLAKVKANQAVSSVSYDPEVWRTGRILASPAA